MLLKTLREEVLEANLELVRRGLVLYTFGNVSGIDRKEGLVAIKPSGVPYEELKPEHIVIYGTSAGAILTAEVAAKGTQPNAITIRGSVEWKEWLDRFAAKMRIKPTAIIDLALAKLADQEGFSEPPPRM